MKNLDYIRILQGKSQKEFAKELGLSQSHYSRLVNEISRRKLSVDSLTCICTKTNCSPCLLLCDDLYGNIERCETCLLYNTGVNLEFLIKKGLNWEQVKLILNFIN